MFSAPMGGLRDPSNTQADLRTVFAAAGYDRVTSHVYRKTVATQMDVSGLTARLAADQFGHAKVSMMQDNYFGREVARTGPAGVLEVSGRVPVADPDVGVMWGKILADHPVGATDLR